jgi:Putative beta-barrel porin 2
MMRTMRAAALILFVSAPARAQTPTPPPTPTQDTPGVLRIGPVTIQPALLIRDIGPDNNVFNEPVNPKKDFTMTFSPRADFTLQVRRVKSIFSQTADYVYFQKYASERGFNQSSALRVEFDLGILQPFASAGQSSSKSRFNNEVDLRARHDTNNFSTGLGVKIFTRTTASVRVRQDDATWDPDAIFRGESLARAFDSRTRGVDGSVGVALTPLTSLSLVLAKERQTFDHAPERDSDTFRIMPTFNFSPLGLVNGTAAFGYRKFTPRDPQTPPFAGFVTQVGAGFTLYDHHRIETTALRDVSYSYDEAATYYIQNSIGVTWTFDFAAHFDTQLNATRNLMDYHQAADFDGGHDVFTSYAAGFGYHPRPRLRLSLNGNFAQRRSELAAARGYDNHRIYASVTWGG